MGVLSSDNPNLGASSALGTGDGELAGDLHDRLDLALQYIANWYRATKGSDNQDLWWAKIDQVRAKVENAERLITAAEVFPTADQVALYNDASSSYASLYTELYTSADTLPQPALIDQAADLVTTIVEAPSTFITYAAGLIGKTAGDAAKQFFLGAWPVLLVGAVVVVVFRKPLAKALAL